MDRCAKPGCGAQRRIGNPCTDWDCPQLTVSAADFAAAILAERERAVNICIDRAEAYEKTRAPGWHEVSHEARTLATAIRTPPTGEEQ